MVHNKRTAATQRKSSATWQLIIKRELPPSGKHLNIKGKRHLPQAANVSGLGFFGFACAQVLNEFQEVVTAVNAEFLAQTVAGGLDAAYRDVEQ